MDSARTSCYIKSRANRESRGEIATGHARGRPSLGVSVHRNDSDHEVRERNTGLCGYVGLTELANPFASQLQSPMPPVIAISSLWPDAVPRYLYRAIN